MHMYRQAHVFIRLDSAEKNLRVSSSLVTGSTSHKLVTSDVSRIFMAVL